MIKITDGVNTKIVTLGMFDNLYSKMGYRVVEDKPIVKQVEEVKEEVKEVLVEKPVEEKPVKPRVENGKKVKK